MLAPTGARRAVQQLRRGHFRLESGHHGELWLDLDAMLADPATLAPQLAALAAALAAHRPEVLCGPLTGGAFVAFDVAGRMGAGFVHVERQVAGSTVSYRLPPGAAGLVRDRRVAVVDDVINAGSATRGTLAALRAAGATPVAIGALIVLGTSMIDWSAEAGLPLVAPSRLENELWLPPDCPLCAAGAPLEDLTA